MSYIHGEWWIDDHGQSEFADGDVGDHGHEVSAWCAALGLPLDTHDGYDGPEFQHCQTLNPEGDAELIAYLRDQGTSEDAIQYFSQRNADAREYMITRKNWIRVKGDNFECGQFNSDALKRIQNFEGWPEEADQATEYDLVMIEEVGGTGWYGSIPVPALLDPKASASKLRKEFGTSMRRNPGKRRLSARVRPVPKCEYCGDTAYWGQCVECEEKTQFEETAGGVFPEKCDACSGAMWYECAGCGKAPARGLDHIRHNPRAPSPHEGIQALRVYFVTLGFERHVAEALAQYMRAHGAAEPLDSPTNQDLARAWCAEAGVEDVMAKRQGRANPAYVAGRVWDIEVENKPVAQVLAADAPGARAQVAVRPGKLRVNPIEDDLKARMQRAKEPPYEIKQSAGGPVLSRHWTKKEAMEKAAELRAAGYDNAWPYSDPFDPRTRENPGRFRCPDCGAAGNDVYDAHARSMKPCRLHGGLRMEPYPTKLEQEWADARKRIQSKTRPSAGSGGLFCIDCGGEFAQLKPNGRCPTCAKASKRRKNPLGPGKRLLVRGATRRAKHIEGKAIHPGDIESPSMTYGHLPSERAFMAAFDRVCPDGIFDVRNDPVYGNHDFTAHALWTAVQKHTEEFHDGDDAAGDWVSCVLTVLGFEWV